MRALIGPLNYEAHRPVVSGLAGIDGRCFDLRGADIAFDPSREPLETLWTRLPQGWQPDCLIWWSPEYSLIPEGIERSPVPSIAVLGDWNLGLWTSAPILEAFDWVVTDAGGVQHLRPQLNAPVDYWPSYSFDPDIHRRRPCPERDIDVLFVGNLNPHVQVERMPWLARLARLSDHHRVLIATGVYGEAYAELLNRTRIAWNRSIRGELNMRAYEAPACGALLFLEEENLEVRNVFTDRESCVLYNDRNLESLVDRYVADSESAERIAELGWRNVQRETHDRHLQALLRAANGLRRGPRTFGTLPPWRRDYWLGLHALASPSGSRIEAALRHFARSLERTTDRATVGAALGALAAVRSLTTDGDERVQGLTLASTLLTAAVAAHDGDLISRVNLGWVAAALGQPVARARWEHALERLEAATPFPVDRIPVPFGFDRFRVEWEQASLPADPEARALRFAPLLQARVTGYLAVLEDNSAASRLTQSVAAAPGIDDNLRRLGEALELAGDLEGAALSYQRALASDPFDHRSRIGAARTALALRSLPSLEQLLRDARRIGAAAPSCRSSLAPLEALVTRIDSLGGMATR